MLGLRVGLCYPSQYQVSHFLLILKIHFVLVYYFLRQSYTAQAKLKATM